MADKKSIDEIIEKARKEHEKENKAKRGTTYPNAPDRMDNGREKPDIDIDICPSGRE